MYSDLYDEMKWKINFIGSLLIIVFILLFFRILYIQLVKGIDYKDFLKKQIIKSEKVRNLRGFIYDRNGEILAFSFFKTSYFCLPQKIQNLNNVKKFVTQNFDVSLQDFEEMLDKNKGFFWIERQSDKKIAKENIPKGIEFIKEEKRVYPNENLASHVIGYTGIDNKGLSGIEYEFDERLRGASLDIMHEKDAKGRLLSSGKVFLIEDNKSQNVYLTIDKNIQIIVEKYLSELMETSKPKTASVIVQKVKTGEILAMANRPDFNGNNIVKDIGVLKNNAVSNIYEPGSTIKVLVAGASLEEGLYSGVQDKIYCEKGKYNVFNYVIRDHDQEYKNITIEDILVYSSNIGMAKIGENLGKDKLYQYLQKFGFNSYTGIELPGEAKGLLKKPMYWYDISPYIIAFGQGIGVTSMQLINAFSALGNFGLMMEPHILKKIEYDDKDNVVKHRKVRQILDQNICKKLLNIMQLVVEKGTAMDAKIFGYKVAGKTGTAQKLDKKTRTYSEKNYIASFIGVFPSDEPMFAILVVADSPKGVYWGGNVCGPVFKKIVRDIAYYLRIPNTEEIV